MRPRGWGLSDSRVHQGLPSHTWLSHPGPPEVPARGGGPLHQHQATQVPLGPQPLAGEPRRSAGQHDG